MEWPETWTIFRPTVGSAYGGNHKEIQWGRLSRHSLLLYNSILLVPTQLSFLSSPLASIISGDGVYMRSNFLSFWLQIDSFPFLLLLRFAAASTPEALSSANRSDVTPIFKSPELWPWTPARPQFILLLFQISYSLRCFLSDPLWIMRSAPALKSQPRLIPLLKIFIWKIGIIANRYGRLNNKFKEKNGFF